MTIAPWRSDLSKAIYLNRSKPFSRYLQLATVSVDGYPTNRTVVFRGFLDGEIGFNLLQFITDYRSEKVIHIKNNPKTEACWYFTKTREQFRITGNLKLISIEEKDNYLQQLRQNMWKNISDSARSQFAWDYPAKKRKDNQVFLDRISKKEPILDTFCLLLLFPQKVDFLQLKGNPQNRFLYVLNEDLFWSIESVNP